MAIIRYTVTNEPSNTLWNWFISYIHRFIRIVLIVAAAYDLYLYYVPSQRYSFTSYTPVLLHSTITELLAYIHTVHGLSQLLKATVYIALIPWVLFPEEYTTETLTVSRGFGLKTTTRIGKKSEKNWFMLMQDIEDIEIKQKYIDGPTKLGIIGRDGEQLEVFPVLLPDLEILEEVGKGVKECFENWGWVDFRSASVRPYDW